MNLRSISLSLLTAFAIASGLGLSARAQTSAPAITNTAQMSFAIGGQTMTVTSNTTSLTPESHTDPTIKLMRLSFGSPGVVYDASDSHCLDASGQWDLVTSTSVQAFDPTAVKLSEAKDFDPGDPVFVQVVAPDSNLDPNVRDTLTVTLYTGGDSEQLMLRETGPNTGVFVGFINSGDAYPLTPSNCKLGWTRGTGSVTATYKDVVNPKDIVSASALVDPFGFVFSSSTSQPVSGAKITLIDDTTSEPAKVYGSDGVSAYPSSVISGATVVDGGGKIYVNLPGEYVFPETAPGRYHFKIEPPAGYTAPSIVPVAKLQSLLTPINTPFIIVPASLGASFDLQANFEIQVDIPIDPHTGGLTLEKTASVTDASFGDLVQYDLKLHNTAAVADAGVGIIDVLPRGFRYVPGSIRSDAGKIAEPNIAADGRTMTFSVGLLSGGGSTEIRYMTRVSANAASGDA